MGNRIIGILHKSVPFLPFLFGLFVFLFLKYTQLAIYISDTNIYFYISHQLLNGLRLYTDIFYTDVPLYALISTFYFLLTRGNVLLFYFTGAIEAGLVASLIYIIVLQQTKRYLWALLCGFFYLFSFFTLQMSSFQNGIFTAAIFALLAYLFMLHKRWYITGLLLAASVMTKVYFAPIAVAFLLCILITKNRPHFFKTLIGFGVGVLIIMGPFLLFSGKDMYSDVIRFSLFRPKAVSVTEVIQGFLSNNISFLLLFIFSVLNFKKNKLLAMISIFTLLCILFYKDFRYLYLNMIIPFLCISLYELLDVMEKKLSIPKIVLSVVVIVILFYNFFLFNTLLVTTNFEKVTQIDTIVKLITKENPPYLYGINQLTPVLGYLTSTPLLEGIFDTNENFFTAKILNAKYLTQKAIERKALVITYAASYPEQNIDKPFSQFILDKTLFTRSCHLLESFPIFEQGIINRINVFRCL